MRVKYDYSVVSSNGSSKQLEELLFIKMNKDLFFRANKEN